uniref:A4_EXTRA domain-containing protein n=1 Tax=Parastrongyloides trichosuri TaxID=131310 RepID=A0A0N4ZW97_PARTI
MLPGSIFIFILQILFCIASTRDGISVSIDSHLSKTHSKFVPMVAFHCGYRNKYSNENGGWTTDDNKYATCLTGKLDILKYCRKVFPNLNVTNIVEYSHEERIENWCSEETKQCKYNHTIRPYRCIDGEFVAQALQVPDGCTFGHIASRSMCNDYSQLNNKAFAACANNKENGRPMVLRSFSVLQPCAIDLFRGVEYVCCPSVRKTKSNDVLTNDIKELTGTNEFGDDEEDETDDLINTLDSEENGTLTEKSEQDPYFKENTNANDEHEKYREAEKRLEQRHRSEVSKIINVWSELYDKYKNMKENDTREAETYKKEMVKKFRKTVATIEEENKEMKKQIETVHEERLKNIFNEKKRKATHEFREALARHVEKDNKAEVVRTLKACIRSEEKDRYHMLNRYRHLLRTDANEAEKFKTELLHNLKYIDLRINGTIAMLADFPQLEETVGPIVKSFWREYRKEHTPEIDSDLLNNSMGENENIKLVNLYKSHYEKLHSAEKNMKKKYFMKANMNTEPSTTSKPTTTTSTTTTTTPAPTTASRNKLHLFNELEKADLSLFDNSKSKEIKDIEYIKFNKNNTEDKSEYDEDEDDDDDDDDDTSEDADDKKHDSSSDSDDSEEESVPVEIEPIISGPIMDSVVDDSPAYIKLSKLNHNNHLYGYTKSQSTFTSNLLIYGFVGTLCSVFVVVAITLYSRNRHSGFVEVDVCTPEERHVNGMQVNGYENPTYTYFDANAPLKQQQGTEECPKE